MSERHQIDVTRIEAERTPSAIGIVHLGLGAFHRAHQAQVVAQCIEAGETDWGITSANLRSGRALVETLRRGDCRYHLAEYRDSRCVTLRDVRAIREAFFTGVDAQGRPGEDLEALLSRMADPATRIVTLTVTEKGYYLNPADGRLRLEDPAVAFDLENPETPHTAPGILCEALSRRRAAGLAPFTVLCCDNMPENGVRTRQAVLGMAVRRDASLSQWIEAEVAFPSSMVDRIVPAMNEDAFARLSALGLDDPAAVISERFLQWVIEEHFPQGRPGWEIAGVEMVEDVTPFETMKLRMLNGAHSLLAYVGPLLGHETVARAVADPDMQRLLVRYMLKEAAPTLEMPAGVDLAAYADALLKRFANDSLHHRLSQIAMDGSQKLPQRWLEGAQKRLETAEATPDAIAATAFGLAAWIIHTGGVDGAGHTWQINDPMADRLAECHDHHAASPAALAAAVLGIREIFPASLGDDPRFTRSVTEALEAIERDGARVALSFL